jgi:hypothetical protein
VVANPSARLASACLTALCLAGLGCVEGGALAISAGAPVMAAVRGQATDCGRPVAGADVAQLESNLAELGYGPDEQVCVVTVGGSAVGGHLLRRVIAAYPEARRLLILCDGGGSNSANQYLFKEDLQRLANRLRLELRVAHYPPYCSKHNPIEHRVFPHVTRACQGVIFHTVNIARQFIERTKTTTGLHVTVALLDKVYMTGRKYAGDFKENMKILFDDHLPKWNYCAVPQPE